MSITERPRGSRPRRLLLALGFTSPGNIISETLTLLRYRRTYREALTFLTEVKPYLHIVHYGEAARTEAVEIFCRYGRDHKISFCDAISFVVVTTILDDLPCLAFDADFRPMGLTVIA